MSTQDKQHKPSAAAAAGATTSSSRTNLSKRPQNQNEATTQIAIKTTVSKQLQLQDAKAIDKQQQQPLTKTQTKLVANLHSAANEGKVELVRLLLRCGADVNAQDEEFSNTALHQAAWNGFSQTVQVLCKYRANTSIRNKAQFTPLHMACQQGHNQTVRLLLMANAKTEAKNSYGDTPLHTAARYGHAGAARILLSAKCNPNQVNKNHDTPLHIAAAMGRRKLTKIFMQNGAEPAIKNKQNETAMDIALRKDLIDIQEIIANPPPEKPSRHTDRATDEDHAHPQFVGQLEQRYGALYAGGRSSGARPKPHHAHQQHAKHRHAHHSHHNHHAIEMSSDEEDNCSASCDGNNKQLAVRLKMHQHNYHQQQHHHQRNGNKEGGRCAELAVDVPAKEVEGAKGLIGGCPEVFASARSLLTADRTRHSNKLRNRSRNKTLSGAMAELRLLTAASAVELNSNRRLTTATTVAAEVAGSQEQEDSCLAPDARDNPREWAEMMAKSGRFQAASPTSPVIELDNQQQSNNGGRLIRRTKSVSPGAGSLRSSLSKSHVANARLVLRSRNRKQSKPGLLVRRPNLGTCVGKLSLLRLRTMVNNKQRKLDSMDVDDNDEEGDNDDDDDDDEEEEENNAKVGGENSNLNLRDIDERSGVKRTTPSVVVRSTGRRQERLERLKSEDSSVVQCNSTTLRAPNGSKLQATRPLAPLNDDTQLYAIPKKPKAKQQVAPTDVSSTNSSLTGASKHNNESCANRAQSTKAPADQQHEEPTVAAGGGGGGTLVRVPSNGPALTSDGCHSSTGSDPGSSSSFARASPPSSSSAIASSSDECIASMDLVCLSNKQRSSHQIANGNLNSQQQPKQQPNLVGVHSVQTDGLDLYAPGYSVIRESPKQQLSRDNQQQQQQQQMVNNKTSEPFLCEEEAEEDDENEAEDNCQLLMSNETNSTKVMNTKSPPTTKRQQHQVAKPSSRLRQLLHLEPKANKQTVSTNKSSQQTEPKKGQQVNGGVTINSTTGYSYTSQDLTKSQVAPKKSWLMSRFSLSSNNLAATNTKNKDTKCGGDLLSANQSDTQNGFVERTISEPLSSAPESGIGDATSTNSSVQQAADNETNTKELTCDEVPEEEDNGGLIRPKSAINSRNSELIAAQKSLAAAAAAKVKRDRLFKISNDSHQQQLEVHHHHNQQDSSTSGVLTVKTSQESFVWNHHHLSQPLVLANGSGQKYIIGGQTMSANHRSGTNSVGMSDSSPSNNGAESDNSIQTTTGSANTDNTSAGSSQPGELLQQNCSSSPLGILSRILLNSKSAGAIRQVASSNHNLTKTTTTTSTTAKTNSINSSGSTLRNGVGGGSLSSSALSSPVSNDQQQLDQTPVVGQKLDQLGSRSRCPIVLARSNELVDNPATSNEQPAPVPRLPAKSALKPIASRQNERLIASSNHHPTLLMEPMNGLPRVASYTQISTINQSSSVDAANRRFNTASAQHTNNNDLTMRQQQQSLCNYHAMNRNHLIQTQYSPYLPYALGRYSIHGHCDPTAAAAAASGNKYLQHHMSHHDLRHTAQSQTIDVNDLTPLPHSAINYEYYLADASPLTQQQQQQQLAFNGGSYRQNHLNPPRYQSSYAMNTTTTTNDNSIYPLMSAAPGTGGGGGGYAHDDSIYIPYLNGIQIRDTTSNTGPTRPATAMASPIGGKGGQYSMHNHQQQVFDPFNHHSASATHQPHHLNHHNLIDPSTNAIHQRPLPPPIQQRPKSSLDTFLLNGASSAAVQPPPPLPAANSVTGRRLSNAGGGSHISKVAVNSAVDHHLTSSPRDQAQQLNNRNSMIFSLANTAVSNASNSGQSTLDHLPNQSSSNHQKLSTAPHYAYSSHPFNRNAQNGYIYSENSIYASDQSAAAYLSQHSDLTVLPTTATATITSDSTSSATSSPYRQSPSNARKSNIEEEEEERKKGADTKDEDKSDSDTNKTNSI